VKKLLGGFSSVIGLLLGVFVLAIVYFLGMSLAKTYLPVPYKCWFMTCELASWEEIQQVALSNVHADEVISDVAVLPKTDFKSAELSELSIRITYANDSKLTSNA
jgi:hypothetical protein